MASKGVSWCTLTVGALFLENWHVEVIGRGGSIRRLCSAQQESGGGIGEGTKTRNVSTRGEARASQGVLIRGDAHSSMGQRASTAPGCLFSRVFFQDASCVLFALPACLQDACAPVKLLFIRDGAGARSNELLIASIDYARNFTAFREKVSCLVRIVVDSSDALHIYQRFGYCQKMS